MYVTDVDHTNECRPDRAKLYLARPILQTQDVDFDLDDDGDPMAIWNGDLWEFEDQTGPAQLHCMGCTAVVNVIFDDDDRATAITEANCPRRTWHYIDYPNRTCEYCLHDGAKAAAL